MDSDQFARVVWGWPTAVFSLCLDVYAVVSLLTGHGERALVLAVIAALNGYLAGRVLLG